MLYHMTKDLFSNKRHVTKGIGTLDSLFLPWTPSIKAVGLIGWGENLLKAHLKLLCRDNINTYKFGTFSFRMWYYCSVVKFCLTLCDPMDGSTPSFPVLHYLQVFAWTHVVYVEPKVILCYCHPTALIHGPLIWDVEVGLALSPSLSLTPPCSLRFY